MLITFEPPQFTIYRQQRAERLRQDALRRVRVSQLHPIEEVILEFVESYFDPPVGYWSLVNHCAQVVGYCSRPEREQRRIEVRRHLDALIRRGKVVRIARKWIRMPGDADLEAQRRRQINERIDAMVKSWPEPNV